MPKLMAEPHDNIKLAVFLVVRFQKTDNKKITDNGGAINPNTAWNVSKRLRPRMLSMAMAIMMANKQPANTVMRPILMISFVVEVGFIFFTYRSVVNTVLSALSDEPIVPTSTAINTTITNPFRPAGKIFVTNVMYASLGSLR